MIYPRKRITDNLKVGAVAGTTFHCSDNGWVNAELFIKWLHFFVESIPPARPVLLILDGHSSHISIEVIEFARSNDVHMLCIPAHTTHILQPLDVGVFKSFKSYYYKACKKELADHPNRVITTEQIAGLVGRAWPQSLTPVNIMSGFKKCGIYPLNPGEITDRQLAPSTLFPNKDTLPVADPDVKSVVKPSSEQDSLYRKRYEEGYDLYDDDYLAWIRDNNLRLPTTDSSEVNTAHTGSNSQVSSVCSTHCGGSTASSLSEILAIPKPLASKKKRRQAVNAKATCITDAEVLEELKHQKEEKEARAEEKRIRKLEREKKKRGKKPSKRQAKANGDEKVEARVTRSRSANVEMLEDIISNLDINETEESGDESEAECPGCGLVYGSTEDNEKWVQCDVCGAWWDLKCTCVDEENVEETRFVCANC